MGSKPTTDSLREDQLRAISSDRGELDRSGANAVVADLNSLPFSETSRTPVDGDESRSQGKFRTTDSTKTS